MHAFFCCQLTFVCLFLLLVPRNQLMIWFCTYFFKKLQSRSQTHIKLINHMILGIRQAPGRIFSTSRKVSFRFSSPHVFFCSSSRTINSWHNKIHHHTRREKVKDRRDGSFSRSCIGTQSRKFWSMSASATGYKRWRKVTCYVSLDCFCRKLFFLWVSDKHNQMNYLFFFVIFKICFLF